MIFKLSAFVAFAFALFLTASSPATAACGTNGGDGNGGTNCSGGQPDGHGVPGPIAGVGLPFLLVGAIAYHRRRKTLSGGKA